MARRSRARAGDPRLRNRNLLVGAGVAAAAVTGYVLWQRSQAAKAAAQAGAGAAGATDGAGGTALPVGAAAPATPYSTIPAGGGPLGRPRDPGSVFQTSPFRVSLPTPAEVVTTAEVLVDRVDVRLRPSPTAPLVNPNDATLRQRVRVHQTDVPDERRDCTTANFCEWWLVTTPGGATGYARLREPNGPLNMFDARLRYTGGGGAEQFPAPPSTAQ